MTEFEAFEVQRKNAIRRCKDWKLTFDEWQEIWFASGKYHLRGRGLGHYCMSRKGDLGAYEVGNVFIQPFSANCSDACSGIPKKLEHVDKVRKAVTRATDEVVHQIRAYPGSAEMAGLHFGFSTNYIRTIRNRQGRFALI